mgnify:FL=1|tara:strand:+ start:402 stop:683 length:282 start_codon:yes stop_codon:yes gene_type:complete
MAFKMKKFSGFKDINEAAEYAAKKTRNKIASKQIKKQLVKQGFKAAARTLGPVGGAMMAYDVAKFAHEKNPEGDTITRLKEDRKNNPNLGRKF